jgi:hypothetical protein
MERMILKEVRMMRMMKMADFDDDRAELDEFRVEQ